MIAIASITPQGFKHLITGVRVIEKAIQGPVDKKIIPEEVAVAKLRAHLNIK